jgi:hypothetical protein
LNQDFLVRRIARRPFKDDAFDNISVLAYSVHGSMTSELEQGR